jgi:hypothetical protein
MPLNGQGYSGAAWTAGVSGGDVAIAAEAAKLSGKLQKARDGRAGWKEDACGRSPDAIPTIAAALSRTRQAAGA